MRLVPVATPSQCCSQETVLMLGTYDAVCDSLFMVDVLLNFNTGSVPLRSGGDDPGTLGHRAGGEQAENQRR